MFFNTFLVARLHSCSIHVRSYVRVFVIIHRSWPIFFGHSTSWFSIVKCIKSSKKMHWWHKRESEKNTIHKTPASSHKWIIQEAMKRGLFIYLGQMHQHQHKQWAFLWNIYVLDDFGNPFRLFDHFFFFLDSTRQSDNTCHLFIYMFRQCQEHPEIYTAFNASYTFLCAHRKCHIPVQNCLWHVCVCMSLMCDDCILPYCGTRACTSHTLLMVNLNNGKKYFDRTWIFFPFSLP